jgi:hypothetical protein
MKPWHVFLLVLLIIALFAIPMVVGPTRSEQGGTVRFAFPWWAVATEAAGSLLALVLCWNQRRSGNVKLLLALLALGLGLPLIHLPAILTNYLVIDEDHLEGRVGMGTTTHPSFRFADVKEIRQQMSANSEGVVRTDRLVCVLRAGGDVSLDATYMLVEPAVPDILRRARQRGVAIVEDRPRR